MILSFYFLISIFISIKNNKLSQGWATSLVGGPDLLKNSFAGHSIFEKFYFKIKGYILEQMCNEINIK